MFARQTGKTFTTTLEIVDDCFAAEAAGKRTRWVILSRGERQAREAIEAGVKRHIEAYGVACQILEGQESVGGIVVNKLEVEFPGGSRVTALPANPDTARGFSANVFLDEFAFHKDSPRDLARPVPGHPQGLAPGGDEYAERQGQQVLRADDRRQAG
jgi:phage FluMu gp28-like protein